MSLNQHLPPESSGQSIGDDPKSSKRNSGLFAFLKWFKPSTSRESIDANAAISESSSSDSLNSIHSAGTVASFSFVPPSAYEKCLSEKCIVLGPETDTYKARLKQRDKRRENDKNLTLRKKYNLFFNRETLLKPKPPEVEEENTKSLPLMTRATMEALEEEVKVHRRANSESSKMRKAGSYLHVKGKRKAPAPPGGKAIPDGHSTTSLRRKKRLAPTPPAVTAEKVINTLQQVDKLETIAQSDTDVLCNDSLKLDHGILKSAKDANVLKPSVDQNNLNAANSPTTSARSSYVETPVSPRPWYKRNSSKESTSNNKKDKSDHKYEHIERLPEVSFVRNSTLDLTLDEVKPEKRKDEKRKSGLSFLTNISELDREASEIIKNKEQEKNGFGDIQEMPEFMRPKDTKINGDSWVSPKRRSARDLIAKFNAITNVTKVTVNTAIFGNSPKDSKLFGKQTSLDETKRRQEYILESHRKRLEEIDNKKNSPLMKSESASAIKSKPETPKTERKNWKCPKSSYASNRNKLEKAVSVDEKAPKNLDSKKEEREKLKRMLIEMKNSLPKRKSNMMMKQNGRASIIVENPESSESEIVDKTPANENIIEKKANEITPKETVLKKPLTEKTQEEKVAEILIGTTETIYENIKVKKTDKPKPVKVSSAAQTSAVVKQVVPPTSIANLIKNESKKDDYRLLRPKDFEANEENRNNYELMRPKDFEDIYADSDGKSAARIYANLARNDELSLFFNMPKNFNNLKNNISQAATANNTDTIEINRLLKRLETSIAKGELTEAAIFAKELAQLKVNCSVIRQKSSSKKNEGKKKGFQIEMYVEDKVSHRGPFPIEVTADQTVADLKRQIENEFEIPVDYQKWILGKELVTNEKLTLKDYNINTEGCPVFFVLGSTRFKPKTKVERSKSPKNEEKVIPSTSNVENPSTQIKLIKEEILVNGTPISKSANEDKIEKVRVNVQNLQNKLNENRDFRKNQIAAQPAIVIKPTKSSPAQVVDTTSGQFVKAFDTKIPESAKAVVHQSLAPSTKITNATTSQVKIVDHIPKIVDVIPKVPEASPKTEILIPITIEQREAKTETKLKRLSEIPISVIEVEIEGKTSFDTRSPPMAKEEDMEEYDTKTLKPAKEWECHLCTLLNPVSSNICAVCATVRIAQAQAPKKSVKKKAPQPDKAGGSSSTREHTYQQLVNLDNADLVENLEPFECVVCFLETPPREGVTLRECLHQFCKACLAHTIEYADEAEVKCPYRDNEYSCNIALQDREIKSLVSPVVYEQHLAKSMAQAENKTDKSFHCKTPDCKGWCIFEDNVNEFRCPVCRKTNCLTCQAIHLGLNCKQYQEKMNQESEVDDDARRTRKNARRNG
ncbi:hypothetical protein NQ317_002395 [Molorchus minor]|uniref:RanBP-type and C3HC4-type zinc finger-containing protein 1 n=1 Tax=Molorchus minor TaxID=1323400 RepID=A0ABQ9J7C8_9CUCU|nr:hypothetical protein NQ317_002395 [Molorchus minor]